MGLAVTGEKDITVGREFHKGRVLDKMRTGIAGAETSQNVGEGEVMDDARVSRCSIKKGENNDGRV